MPLRAWRRFILPERRTLSAASPYPYKMLHSDADESYRDPARKSEKYGSQSRADEPDDIRVKTYRRHGKSDHELARVGQEGRNVLARAREREQPGVNHRRYEEEYHEPREHLHEAELQAGIRRNGCPLRPGLCRSPAGFYHLPYGKRERYGDYGKRARELDYGSVSESHVAPRHALPALPRRHDGRSVVYRRSRPHAEAGVRHTERLTYRRESECRDDVE